MASRDAAPRPDHESRQPEACRCGSADTLLQRARAGSHSSLGLLFETFRDYLLCIARDELADDLRPKISASDLVQQTLLEAHQGFRHFQGQSPEEVQAWLRRVLLNNVLDATKQFRQAERRAVNREVSVGADDSARAEALALIDPGPSPSWLAVAAEERRSLMAALDELPAHYRTAIVLRNLQFQTHEQVASELGLSTDAARKLWGRAIVALAKRLAGEVDTTKDDEHSAL
ncbi:MAG: RNA polymerase sigma factor [Pirellulales bacterium]|nr:RNA polymerase sigma factor [Pirellulales bacterium]